MHRVHRVFRRLIQAGDGHVWTTCSSCSTCSTRVTRELFLSLAPRSAQPNVKKLHDWMRPVVTLSHCVGQCVQSHVGVLFGNLYFFGGDWKFTGRILHPFSVVLTAAKIGGSSCGAITFTPDG